MEGRSKQKRQITRTWNKTELKRIHRWKANTRKHMDYPRGSCLCDTNLDEPLRFVWHQLKDMCIYESSYVHGKEQGYWNKDRDSNLNTSIVGPLDSLQLYWGADRNRKKRQYQHHKCKRPLRRQACSLPHSPIHNQMQTDCRYIIYELEPLYE